MYLFTFALLSSQSGSIKKETDLEELRMEMTGRVKARFGAEDAFWKTAFNCTREDRGDDILLSEDEC